MTTFDTGRRAEAIAAGFLAGKGCTIICQNWRTRHCEIDIVAQRSACIYFCEVKYRATTRFGKGLEYITPSKLRQMRFAAELWVASHYWDGEYQLCAIEVTGADYRITNVIKDL